MQVALCEKLRFATSRLGQSVAGRVQCGIASAARSRQSSEQTERLRQEQRKQDHQNKDWSSLLTLLNQKITGLPHLIGFRVDHVEHGRLIASLPIKSTLLAGNGFLHAGTVVTLADTACGYGCFVSLPPERVNFATVQLSCQFLGTALAGELEVEASLRHAGKSTQVWDAEVRTRTSPEVQRASATIALFRCTQLLLEAKPASRQENDSNTHVETHATS
jgi:uncharacterized protein (TIGR00369 family)